MHDFVHRVGSIFSWHRGSARGFIFSGHVLEVRRVQRLPFRCCAVTPSLLSAAHCAVQTVCRPQLVLFRLSLPKFFGVFFLGENVLKSCVEASTGRKHTAFCSPGWKPAGEMLSWGLKSWKPQGPFSVMIDKCCDHGAKGRSDNFSGLFNFNPDM